MSDPLLSFKPKQVSRGLFAALPPRAGDILKKRFGLEKGGERWTLEAIGQKYDITRERVRQIENFAFKAIKQSTAFKDLSDALSSLAQALENYGTVAHETDFLDYLTKEEVTQNHLYFLLVLGDQFIRLKEDDEFYDRWTTNSVRAEKIAESLRRVHQGFSEKDLLAEEEILGLFMDKLKGNLNNAVIEREQARRWLNLSKVVGRNPLGEWGLVCSPNVRIRGVRDCAFLVMRKHGSPMHFTEVASNISKEFGREAHPATCHNEVIKDPRFVLVGRGLYALAEWGYTKGIVRDVIRAVLAEAGPLSREEIIQKVLKERYVKANTILVNLQNPKYFRKAKDGKYLVA